MSLNVTSLVARVAGLGLKLDSASAVVSGLIGLIEAVENLCADLKGSEKFAAVKSGMKTLLEELGLDDDFDRIWRALAPLVSLIVTIYNFKSLWPKPPAPAPASSPAPGLVAAQH